MKRTLFLFLLFLCTSLFAEEHEIEQCKTKFDILLTECSKYLPTKKDEFDSVLLKYSLMQSKIPTKHREKCADGKIDIERELSNQSISEVEKICNITAYSITESIKFIEQLLEKGVDLDDIH